MKDLNVIAGPVPKGFKPDFESFLFNDVRHLRLQAENNWHTFSLTHSKGKRVLAAASFHLQNNKAVSPLRAPFGSFQFSNTLAPKEVYDFIGRTEQALRELGATEVEVTNPPHQYAPSQISLLEVFLFNRGYQVSNAEVSAIINVDKTPYESRVEPWEVRKLRQGKKAGLLFRQIPVGLIEGVYGLIAACRQERQQSLSMTLEQLRTVIDAFPDRIVLNGVFKDKELIAASIAIRVSQSILYNFYSAHLRQFDKLSPVVMLINGMYGNCRRQKIQMLDLGTSAIEGQPNFGLLDFKVHLDGRPSHKLTFRKKLM